MNHKKVLVCAAHPDDEVLGCGASIAKWIAGGAQVEIIIAAEGLTSRNSATSASELEKLKETARQACKVLGVQKVHFLSLPDNKMDLVPMLDIIKPIEQIIEQLAPDTIVTHHPGDVNVDHKLLFEAVVTAARPLPKSPVKSILTFEVASSSGWGSNLNANPFNPNYFVDVSKYLTLKMKALEVYSSEMRPYPHARSMENLKNISFVRGATVGVEAAEAFQVCRILED